MLSTFEAELKLLIPGNHDASLDEYFYLREGGTVTEHQRAKDLMSGEVARHYGVTFVGEGTNTFQLRNGACFTIYMSSYTPKYGISAFQYSSAEDRFNPTGSTLDWAISTATSQSSSLKELTSL